MDMMELFPEDSGFARYKRLGWRVSPEQAELQRQALLHDQDMLWAYRNRYYLKAGHLLDPKSDFDTGPVVEAVSQAYVEIREALVEYDAINWNMVQAFGWEIWGYLAEYYQVDKKTTARSLYTPHITWDRKLPVIRMGPTKIVPVNGEFTGEAAYITSTHDDLEVDRFAGGGHWYSFRAAFDDKENELYIEGL